MEDMFPRLLAPVVPTSCFQTQGAQILSSLNFTQVCLQESNVSGPTYQEVIIGSGKGYVQNRQQAIT